ncbi:hypothetical protein [Streptomyces sp. URMC 125]|uniref:hypothetical protein n=1 Tax=Streptomyces sp. URMC 125 TaxID=3423419 RepID=UPI003F1AEDB1
MGAAVVAAVWAAAAERADRGPGLPPRAVAGTLLAPLGWFAYVGRVGLRTGSPPGHRDVQGRWGNGFDGGAAFAAFAWAHPTGRTAAGPAAGPALLAGVVLARWLCVPCVRRRPPRRRTGPCGRTVRGRPDRPRGTLG